MQPTELSGISEKVANVLRRYPIAKAAIFGSFARGTENKQSDIDILIEVSKPVSLFQLLRIEKELQDITNRKIDLVEYSAIKKSIKSSVLKEAISILL